MKRDRHDPRRGRHRKAASRETLVWNREHLIPARPPWMPPVVYRALAELREQVR